MTSNNDIPDATADQTSADGNIVVSGDQRDARTFFNFGNREDISASFGVLNVHEDSIEYDMKHKKFGRCLIFNHEFYKDGKNLQRNGSTADASALFQTFSKIGFDVTMKNDLPYKKIIDCMATVAKEDHSDHDCLVCCILTHGETGDMLWAYDDLYSLNQILDMFTGDKCKSLAGKPKIFFIQACRGTTYDDGVTMQVQLPRDVTDSGRYKSMKIPVYADYLIAFSAMSGWRNPATGSWFINHLTEVLNQYYTSYDLLSMMTIVNQRVAYHMISRSTDQQYDGKKQVPCVTHTLTRKVFFAPKDNGPKSTYL